MISYYMIYDYIIVLPGCEVWGVRCEVWGARHWGVSSPLCKGQQVSEAQSFPTSSSRAKHKLIGDNCLFIVKVSQLYQRTYMITGARRLTPGVLLGPLL